jgi:DNA-binding NtrC family response regulator
MKKILIIDDEEVIVDAASIILEDMGYAVSGFKNSEEGIEAALNGDFDLIVTDLRMPKVNGAQVTKRILSEKPDSNILIITAYPTDPLAKEALDAGAKTLLKKPFEIAKIVQFLED